MDGNTDSVLSLLRFLVSAVPQGMHQNFPVEGVIQVSISVYHSGIYATYQLSKGHHPTVHVDSDGVKAVADAFIYFTYFEVTGLRDNKLPAITDRLGMAERDVLRNPQSLAQRIRTLIPGQFHLP